MLTARLDSTTDLPVPGRYMRAQTQGSSGVDEDGSISRSGDRARLEGFDELGTSVTSAEDGVVVRFVDPGTEQEYDELLAEQSRLARKQVMETLSRSERLQLKMVRWAIDRVENARMKADLDRLNQLASLHERLAREITRLVDAAQGE